MNSSEHHFSPAHIRLIIGLGNPGAYQGTYHNAGKLALRYFLEHTDAHSPERRTPLLNYWTADTRVFAETKTFMNESGRAVLSALRTFRVAAPELLILHDESDLPLGTYRFSFGRSAAGHRGVASVIDALGTKNFWRLRIGIRRTSGKAGEFVLRRIGKADRDTLYSAFEGASKKLTENARPSGLRTT